MPTQTKEKRRLARPSPAIILGTDPEFFFKTRSKIVGAEKFLPKTGVSHMRGRVVIDGIQAELNPESSYCREILATNIAYSFKALHEHLQATKAKIKVACDQNVDISKKEMESLSPKSKELGCTPSLNIYDSNAKVGVSDASRLFKRSAGGHIHLGCPDSLKVSDSRTDKVYTKLFRDQPHRVVQMLDIVCGNTCVLIDRDKGNAERRKYYGRAGEYRLPQHGLEYRTLSNFWLTSYTLMSFATSLARLAFAIVYATEKFELDIEERILKAVDPKDIIKAINENDFDLAKSNFDKIKNILTKELDPVRIKLEWLGKGEYRDDFKYIDPPFTTKTLPAFEKFVMTVKRKGLKHYFANEIKNPVKYWRARLGSPRPKDYTGRGWESFVHHELMGEED